MRRKLLKEDMKQPNGMFVTPGAIVFDPDDVYPVFLKSFDRVAGRLSDIRREDDGWITGEVNLTDTYQHEEDSFDFSLYCDGLEKENDFVKSADLRGVVLIPALTVKLT